MDIFIVVTLCILGILLILVEIFLIPGVTIAAIIGAVFALGGIFYAFSSLGTTAGIITVAVVSVVTLLAVVYLIKSKALDSIALKTDISSTVASESQTNYEVGDEGVTISRLNPIGKVKVNGVVIEGKSIGDFINEDTPIVVVKVSPTQLLVKTK
ncbi:membrane-bound ClpP family serine protease [Dysgonomonadaceae bacterium PH5-43]|nr:membrane-bound ClpP family serine protease [Dysgonomonadaceae bacterium PH5-43]